MMTTRSAVRATALAAALVLVLLSGCTRNQRAERDGKEAGEAVCDVRDADDAAEADEARADALEELGDLADTYLRFTAEDRADVAENVDDLVEHVVDGNEALARQDVAVIARSLGNIDDDLGDASQAAASGFVQGVDDCV
jgi:hypothetical protein